MYQKHAELLSGHTNFGHGPQCGQIRFQLGGGM